MRILVVCAAGASSTFVVQRARSALNSAGLPHTVQACTEATVDQQLPGTGLVLLGAHLPASDQLRARAESCGAAAVVLPEDIAADIDGSRTLELILDALPDHRTDHRT